VSDETPTGGNALLLAIVVGAVPVLLWGTLTLFAPKMLVPLGEHPIGDRIAIAQGLLVLGGFISLITSSLQRTRFWRVLFAMVGLVVCTLPATVLVWFGGALFAGLRLNVY